MAKALLISLCVLVASAIMVLIGWYTGEAGAPWWVAAAFASGLIALVWIWMHRDG